MQRPCYKDFRRNSWSHVRHKVASVFLFHSGDVRQSVGLRFSNFGVGFNVLHPLLQGLPSGASMCSSECVLIMTTRASVADAVEKCEGYEVACRMARNYGDVDRAAFSP